MKGLTLRSPGYIMIGLFFSLLAFCLYPLLLNYNILSSTAFSGNWKLFFRMMYLLVKGYPSTTPPLSLFLTGAISLAIGVNLTLALYRLFRMSTVGREEASSLGAILLSMVVPACPVCATSVLAIAGLPSLFGILPFGGIELKVLALLWLIGSGLWIGWKIRSGAPKTCHFEIPPE